MNRFYLNFLFLLTMLSTPIVSNETFAGEKWNKQHHARMEEHLADELKLTEKQRTQLREIHKKDESKERELRDKQIAEHDRLDKALQSNASKDELRKIHEEMQKIRKEKEDLRFERILAIREILTPEQRKQFQEMKKEKKGRFGHHHRKGKMDHEEE